MPCRLSLVCLCALALSATALVACESDGGGSALDAADGAGDTAGAADAPSDAGPDGTAACPGGRELLTISGQVVDEAGAPVYKAKAQACIRTADTATLYCLNPADTGFAGEFAIGVPEAAQCAGELAMRVLVPGQDLATGYCAITLSDGGTELALDRPVTLFATERATSLPDPGDGTGVVTVAFADGLEVDLRPNDLFIAGEGYDGLAAKRVNADPEDLCMPASLAASGGAWAFSPEGEVFEATAGVRMPDVLGLGDGAAVDVFMMGGVGCSLADGSESHEGVWTPIGQATVQGGVVALPKDAGLPCLTWVTYAPRQP